MAIGFQSAHSSRGKIRSNVVGKRPACPRFAVINVDIRQLQSVEADLVWPISPVFNQSAPHRIFLNVKPFFMQTHRSAEADQNTRAANSMMGGVPGASSVSRPLKNLPTSLHDSVSV